MMEDFNWIYMTEKLQEIKLFSRNMIYRTTKEYQIPAQHLDLLSQLVIYEESMTPMTLSKIMGVNKTIISRIIDKLAEEGYITKIKDQNDKRSYAVEISDKGRGELDRIYKCYLSPIYELRRKLGDEEFLKLIGLIENANEKMSIDIKKNLQK